MNLIDILNPPKILLDVPSHLAVKYGPDWEAGARGAKEPLDDKLEEALRGAGWLTVAQIGAVIFSPDDSIRRALGRLVRKGLVASKGKKPGMQYAWVGEQK